MCGLALGFFPRWWGGHQFVQFWFIDWRIIQTISELLHLHFVEVENSLVQPVLNRLAVGFQFVIWRLNNCLGNRFTLRCHLVNHMCHNPADARQCLFCSGG